MPGFVYTSFVCVSFEADYGLHTLVLFAVRFVAGSASSCILNILVHVPASGSALTARLG